MGYLALRIGFCSYYPHAAPAAREWFEEISAPQPVTSVAEKFCQDTFDASNAHRIRFKVLEDRVEWFHVEWFCQWTRWIVDPGGWLSLFEPDLPSLQRMRDQAFSLCDAMRRNDLDFSEAWYRFQQEMWWAKKHLGPETAKNFGKGLEAILGAAKKYLIE